MTKIGFLGPKGTFSQEAMEEYIRSGSGFSPVDYNTIPDIIIAVDNGEIDEAIVPMENSLEGSVNATIDMLAFDVGLFIKAEVVIPVRQNLLIKKGTSLADITQILSHSQPLGQCRKYLNANFPDACIRIVYSTAGAAEEVASSSGHMAAIGSITAAKVYGLEAAATDIQDEDSNFTRFVVVSKSDAQKTGCDKTSVVFSTDDKPGSLYRILDIFNLWDINMERIESRPAKNQLGKYVFFVDIEGHRDDQDIQDALTMVRRKTSFYKFLGSYPKHVNTAAGIV